MATKSTYVNFSTPHRRAGGSKDKQLRAQPSMDEVPEDQEVLAYRPAKANYIQLHVTSDQNAPREINNSQPSTSFRPSQPAIPERTTSLSSRPGSSWTTSSQGSKYRFDKTPTLVRTPWEWDRGRPGSRWARTPSVRSSRRPQPNFPQLPREIYTYIVDSLESIHKSGDYVNVRDLRNDLLSVCLVDRQWHRAGRARLLRELWLPSNKAPAKRRFSFRAQPRSRMKMLLTALCTYPALGPLIHTIHIPAEFAAELEVDAYASFKPDSHLDALQELVRRCYSLEQICGYVPPATETTRVLFEALATRTRLKTQAWNLDSTATLPSLAEFIHFHDDWMRLETLIIAGDPGVDLGIGSVSAILEKLPSLKHLMLSGLHHSDFNNGTILALPALKSLRLDALAGVTDEGIEQLAFSRLVSSLERLTLVDLELQSLRTIKAILINLPRLSTLSLKQNASPEPQAGVSFSMPLLLASPTLTCLHWDCLIPGTALSWLADAIEGDRLPVLKTIRVPCDYDGVIQTLCRPIPRSKLTSYDLQYHDAHTEYTYERDLRVSHIQAQLRVRESRRKPSFTFQVQDGESMEVQHTHVIGSYVGNMESGIEYDLTPAIAGKAMADFDDIARPKRHAGGLERSSDYRLLF